MKTKTNKTDDIILSLSADINRVTQVRLAPPDLRRLARNHVLSEYSGGGSPVSRILCTDLLINFSNVQPSLRPDY